MDSSRKRIFETQEHDFIQTRKCMKFDTSVDDIYKNIINFVSTITKEEYHTLTSGKMVERGDAYYHNDKTNEFITFFNLFDIALKN